MELFEAKYMRLHVGGLKRLELASRYGRMKKSSGNEWKVR